MTRLRPARTRARFRALTLAASAAAAVLGCALPPCPSLLPTVRGTVIDRETGEGVPGAMIVQAYGEYDWWGEGRRSYYHRDVATTDATGAFVIPRHLSPNVWMWLFRNEDLGAYGFYHPAYGW